MKKRSESVNYVMYGFCKSDKNDVGYLEYIPTDPTQLDYITTEIKFAKKFPSKNIHKKKGFGTPQQWLKFINEELDDLFGEDAFNLHLVKTTL